MKKAVCLLVALVLAAVLSGCGLIRIEEEERKPVDYTVVERQDIPAALDEIMNEKKEKEFQLSYQTGEALYLAKGYGRQMSGGTAFRWKNWESPQTGFFLLQDLLARKILMRPEFLLIHVLS